MISYFRDDDDGMDPGLGEMSYDDQGYEMDEFGERIGTSEDDMYEDTAADEADLESADDGTAASDKRYEDGFHESLNPEQNPHLNDQLEDPDLNRAADADYDAEGDRGHSASESEEDRPVL